MEPDRNRFLLPEDSKVEAVGAANPEMAVDSTSLEEAETVEQGVVVATVALELLEVEQGATQFHFSG